MKRTKGTKPHQIGRRFAGGPPNKIGAEDAEVAIVNNSNSKLIFFFTNSSQSNLRFH